MDLKQHLITNGKTASWLALANEFGITGDNKQKSDYVRKAAQRLGVTGEHTVAMKAPVRMISDTKNKLLDEFKEFLANKYSVNKLPSAFTTGDPNNILVIPDLHIPFEHPDALLFIADVQRKWNCGKVISIGDLVDNHANSYHESDPQLPSAGYEFETTKTKLKQWNALFPKTTMVLGNHDRLVARKMFSGGVNKDWVRGMAETYGLDWTILPDYLYNGVYFVHGEGAKADTTALQKHINTVSGHHHSSTYVRYVAKDVWGMQLPVLINREELAFNYAKQDPKDYTLGCGVILNSKQPLIELM